MDIWSWVYDEIRRLPEEDRRLGALLHRLPSWVTDNDYARVDGAMPELIAGLRRLRRPWLEVFARHWHLQSLVLDRHDIRGGLHQAIELMERAHQDDAKGCPQTTCVSQDVCAAYGVVDGPGFAPERLAVAEETLARIDAAWPCWSCIRREQVSALIDQGAHEAALERCAAAKAEIRGAGEDCPDGEFVLQEAEALLELGRPEEARERLALAERPGGGRRFERHKRVLLACCLAAMGRSEAALATLPPPGEVEGMPYLYMDHARAALALVRAGALPCDAALHALLVGFLRQKLTLGAVRDAATLGRDLAALCCDLGRPAQGLAALELARPALARLHRPLGEPEAHAALRAELERLAALEAPEGEAEALDWWAADPSLERGEALARRHPAALPVALELARSWRAHGHPERAREALERAALHHPGDPGLVLALGELLLAGGELDALRAWLERLGDAPAARAPRVWLASRLAEALGRPDEALAALSSLVEGGGADEAMRLHLARSLVQRGLLAEALPLYAGLAEAAAPDADVAVELLMLATRLGDEAQVRAVAPRVAGAADGDGARLRLRFDDDPPEILQWAWRIGPCAARVASVAGPGKAQRYRDEVVFDPRPLAAPEGEPPLHRVVATLRPGDHLGFDLDGVHPGEARLDALADLLAGVRGALQVRSGEDYRLTDPETGESVPGVYAHIAWPRANPLPVLALLLEQGTRGAPGPLVWTALARALGDEPTARRHEALAQAWGM